MVMAPKDIEISARHPTLRRLASAASPWGSLFRLDRLKRPRRGSGSQRPPQQRSREHLSGERCAACRPRFALLAKDVRRRRSKTSHLLHSAQRSHGYRGRPSPRRGPSRSAGSAADMRVYVTVRAFQDEFHWDLRSASSSVSMPCFFSTCSARRRLVDIRYAKTRPSTTTPPTVIKSQRSPPLKDGELVSVGSVGAGLSERAAAAIKARIAADGFARSRSSTVVARWPGICGTRR